MSRRKHRVRKIEMHLSYENLEKNVAADIAASRTDFGHPEGARDAIVWTETILGRGFELLRLAASQQKGGVWLNPAILEGADSAQGELAGLPLFGFAARLADLAMKDAGSAVFRTIEAHGPFGGWVAPYIAFLLSRSAHHAAILWRPAIAEDAPKSLVLAAATPPGRNAPPIMIAPGAAYGAKVRDKILVGDVPLEFIDRLHAVAARRPEQSLCAIVAASAVHDAELGDLISLGDAVLSFELESRAPELLDAAPRIAEAKRVGLSANPIENQSNRP